MCSPPGGERPRAAAPRYDGYRFIAMLPSTGRQAADAAGDQVEEKIACGEVRGCITVSFGATEYRRSNPRTTG